MKAFILTPSRVFSSMILLTIKASSDIRGTCRVQRFPGDILDLVPFGALDESLPWSADARVLSNQRSEGSYFAEALIHTAVMLSDREIRHNSSGFTLARQSYFVV
ncbi:hypothetical protein BJF83_01930 [Nocardiopsis sp. CNR-923]|uniref:hypothetical protein n=1 Tax=Nocardiopsis sp. CNR-923 TaxID=1904965 RepID=UPI0009639985|nr:hypothetical protein [Nocardiopsis sp. CNR-923]OLT27365.1 hypothetical protein BJF83_01930 [Nocardiopsis sp. CNR-923]